ncbi:signal peptidase I [Tessaracoccus sp.]
MSEHGRHRSAHHGHAHRAWSAILTAGKIITALTVAVAAATALSLAWFNTQHQQLLIVSSGSMTPTFTAGDVVIVKHADPAKLRTGDVVTFVATGTTKTTTHRIHALKPQPSGLFLQTKGDANTTPDPNFTPAANVTGLTTGTIPHLGWWLAAFQSKLGKILILGGPLLLILTSQLVSTIGDLAKLYRARVRRNRRSVPATGQ